MAVKKKTKKTAAKKPAAKKTPKKSPPAKKAAPKAKVETAVSKAKNKNFSNLITPLDDRLLIAVRGPSETTAGGIIIPGNVATRPNRGTVLAKGRGHRNKKGRLRPLDVEVGDEILFAEYAGSKLTVEGEELLILRENEVLGIVD